MKKDTITDSIIQANERLLKKDNSTLSEEQTNILYTFEILPTNKLILSFWKDRIKTNPIEINNVKYMIDFFINDNTTLIGKLKDNKYSIEEVEYKYFKNWLEKELKSD